jgi:flagellar biosynthesis/type III secretory pathway M-ring protein FliF/YscJ
MDETWVAMLWALLPTVVVSVVFFFILRNVIRMDRTERKVYSRIEAQERAKRGLPPVAPTGEGPAN